MALTACGGGGGSSDTGGSGGGGTPPPPPPVSLRVSSNSLSVTSDTSTGGTVIYNPLSIAVDQALSTDTYYYSVTFVGTAITMIAINGLTSTTYANSNPTVGATPKLAYAVGGTYQGQIQGSSPYNLNQVDFVAPAIMGAGTYSDTITIAVCRDSACSDPIDGSPSVVHVSYRVTGNATPTATVTVYPNVTIDLPSSQTTAGKGSVQIDATGFPPTGIYVTTGTSKNGLATGMNLQTQLGNNGGNIIPGTVDFTLPSPSTAGGGMHTDSFQLNACYDAGCARPVAGSPWTVNISYLVEASVGVDYAQKTLAMSVGGIVWSTSTHKLYVSIPNYSPQYPNSIAQIDPVTGTVEKTVAVPVSGGNGYPENATLAISDDGQYLYVAAAAFPGGDDHIVRLRTSDLGSDLEVVPNPAGRVVQIAVAPGAPHTFLVVTESPSSGLLVYDDATVRGPAIAASDVGYNSSATWGTDASTLYAISVASSQSSILSATAAAPPAATRSQQFDSATTNASGVMHALGARVLWDSGTALDTSAFTFSHPFTFYSSGGNTVRSSAGAFDTSLNRSYFLTDDAPTGSPANSLAIQSFDLTGGSLKGLLRYPTQNYEFYLTRWGANGLAFSTSAGTESLVIISGPFVTQ